jgi:hypothetical protein
MAVGVGTSIMGSLQAASGARAMGKQALTTAQYNQSIRDRNARVADQEADLRDRVTGRQEFRSREQFAKLQARGRTAYAKAGVVASTGTPLAVLKDNADKFEEDIELNRLQGTTESGRIRESATNQRLAGQLALLEGQSRKMAADIQARGHMFSALSSIAKGAYQYSQVAPTKQIA